MSDGTEDEQQGLLGRLKKDAKKVSEEIRPWAEFVGPVSLPRIYGEKPELGQRLETNLCFFKVNYILIMLVFCVYRIITNPGLAFLIILAGSLYYLVLFTRKSPIVIGELRLRTKEQLIIVSVFFILALVLTGYHSKIRFSLAIGGIVCFLHAVFRPPVSRAFASREGEKAMLRETLDDMEGGSSFSSVLQDDMAQDPYDLPANANIRLRSRPLPNSKYPPGPPRHVLEKSNIRTA